MHRHDLAQPALHQFRIFADRLADREEDHARLLQFVTEGGGDADRIEHGIDRDTRKNLLLDNLLLVDIYNRAKKLHIEVEARRLVFILETNPDKNSGALESVKSLLGTKSGDFRTCSR